ncbi:class I SAM-dependent methyltransferase [Plebeiibacterium marinum]|uniref:Class I SAM-dependent methyltransferase n=1 Tax=Plebeiibacterium marinum TaxID=2992111 RepID=A0AAE3SIH9_9BACT|nr:class I SAM-dependent methyltransferase [Plebeiobacterium marinum]MCW3804652.1 class I SAM-dependent methyltransferase [Plebeiobacterium marinum]
MNYLEINQNLWNKKTDIHYKSDFYDVPAFINGKSSLNPIELELLGDLRGKSVLHLQCHFGMDTISLSRLGAKATGIDLSDKAIEKARELANQAGTDTQFIQSDVYSLKEALTQKYDIVYTSYGVIGWLPDMNKWAEIINHFLKPGGKFIMVEFHPVVWMFSYDFKKIEYNYFGGSPIIEELEGTYTDSSKKSDIKEQSVSWNHSLAEVITALLKKGLSVDHFNEYDYSPYNCFDNTIENTKGKYQINGIGNKIPMLYSIVCSRS